MFAVIFLLNTQSLLAHPAVFPLLLLLLLLVLAPSPSLCQDKRSIAFSDGTEAKSVANREDNDIGAAKAAAAAAKRALAAGEHQVYILVFSLESPTGMFLSNRRFKS